MSTPLWSPSAEAVAASSLTRLSKKASEISGRDLSRYRDLHRWSITEVDAFWKLIWEDAEIIGESGDVAYRPGATFIDAQFFPDASINVTENIINRGSDDVLAIIEILEDGSRSELTWRELREKVAATTAALRAEGIATGDRICAWSPNVTEVMIYGLAALALGAIVSTASPDFAPHAVQDRFGQIEPRLILAARNYQYNGKIIDCMGRLKEILELIPSIGRAIVIGGGDGFISFDEWIEPFMGAQQEYVRTAFNHPSFVLFSSGTTGKPKCITHSGAGILLKTASEQIYSFDLTNDSRIFYFTTCGWMMWNWLFMALARGGTIVLFDGAPMYPTPKRLFDLAQDERVSFFGVSAKFIDSANKEGLSPRQSHNLEHLRTIGSTGSVLSPASFDYVYQEIKSDVHLASLSGGTDICGCFVAGVPTEAVYRGEIQGPCLGTATNVFDHQGNPAAVGEKGELVCTVPFPSKPIGFWGDTNNEKYRAAYFEGFPGVWTHGDFASISETGGFTIFGRSDATLNSKGVRIGTAEIYRVVENIDSIRECMAVSQDWEDDSRIILFVVLNTGASFTPELVKEIRDSLRKDASPRHVPEVILEAPELPRTKSNKIVELAVTDVINGRVVRNKDALANPGALDWFERALSSL
jgi:acetoacetyl-CoA synthetase